MNDLLEVASDLYKNDQIKKIVNVIIGVFIVFYVLIILSLIKDALDRIKNKYLAVSFAIVSSIFFIPGFIIYYIFRPKEKLSDEESRDVNLEFELALTSQVICWKCKLRIDKNSNFCHGCGVKNKNKCIKCDAKVSLLDNFCFNCGVDKSNFIGLDIGNHTAEKPNKIKEIINSSGIVAANFRSKKISTKETDDSFIPLIRRYLKKLNIEISNIFASFFKDKKPVFLREGKKKTPSVEKSVEQNNYQKVENGKKEARKSMKKSGEKNQIGAKVRNKSKKKK